MATARAHLKVARIGYLIARFLLDAKIASMRAPYRAAKLRALTENAGRYARLALDTLEIQVELKGPGASLLGKRPFLMAGNHLSYLDALTIASVRPSIFVTSVDMGETPVIGEIARLGGSVFVERRHRERVSQDRNEIGMVLAAGHSVMIYPEGTSTCGDTVLPFKKTLLMSAVDAGVDVLPITVSYPEVDARSFGPATRDLVCWYGEMGFFSHLRALAGARGAKCVLYVSEPILAHSEITRDELAERSHKAVSQAFIGANSSTSGPAQTLAL